MVALEVVKKRLTEVRLDDFYLTLHSRKVKKKIISINNNKGVLEVYYANYLIITKREPVGPHLVVLFI